MDNMNLPPREGPSIDEDFDAWWKRFASMSIPQGAPRVQYQEMRKAFLMGCYTAMVAMKNIPAERDEEEVTARLSEVLKNLEGEVLLTMRDLISGRG